MADELDDNYLLDDAVPIADSDNEAEAVSVDGDEGVAQLDDDDASPPPAASKAEAEAAALASKENKKRKRKEKDKLRKQKRASLSAEHSQGFGSVAAQPPDMQADYLSVKQSKAFPKHTDIELGETRISEAMLVDTTSFDLPRKEDALSAFVKKYLPKVSKALEDQDDPVNTQFGTPSLLVLTGNAMRAADLARGLRPLNPRPQKKQKTAKEAKASKNDSTEESSNPFSVAKLFARHYKLKEHQEWLSSHVTPLAVGTPQRVGALIASESLNLDSLQAIIIDQTWVDAKQRSVFDTPETRDELLKLIGSQQIMSRLKKPSSPVKVLLF